MTLKRKIICQQKTKNLAPRSKSYDGDFSEINFLTYLVEHAILKPSELRLKIAVAMEVAEEAR